MSNLLIGLFLGILLGLAIPPFYKWIVKKVTKSEPVNKTTVLILLPLLALGFSGCGKFPDGTSVWGGGLGVIPFVLFGGSAWFFYTAWRKSKSGSEQQTPTGYIFYKDNVAIYKIGQFWFGVALAVAGIAVVIAVNWAK